MESPCQKRIILKSISPSMLILVKLLQKIMIANLLPLPHRLLDNPDPLEMLLQYFQQGGLTGPYIALNAIDYLHKLLIKAHR